MIRMPRLAARRSTIVTAGAVVVLAALIGGIAVASDGYRSERVDLGDGAVWVSNEEIQAVGRANTMVHELDAAVETGSGRVDVVQQGATVLVVDRANARASVLDPATATLVDTIAIPPDDPSLAIGGSRVVVSSQGAIWTAPVDEFAAFDADAPPEFEFGPDSLVSVDSDGRIFAYRPSTGEVVELRASSAASVGGRWTLPPVAATSRPSSRQLTSVADHWAVLDPDAPAIIVDGRSVPLDGLLEAGDIPVLQAPSTTGDEIAIGTRRGLVVVPVDGGAPSARVTGRAGLPAQPVRHEGCLHAAWAEGTAWRECPGRPGAVVELEDGSASASLEFRENGDALVLDAPTDGRSWAAADDYGLIDDWTLLVDANEDDRTVERNDPATPPTVELAQAVPTAVDDALGARPGRSTLLPVLLNDYDPNGDVLAIQAIDATLPPGASLDIVSERQELQLTLGAEASGSVRFGYTVDDGRGGVASAVVTVEVHPPEQNAPPEQRRGATAAVSAGGRVTLPVLGEWVDPDGDPFFLASAGATGSDEVSATPDGVVVFNERSGAGGSRTVALEVSDGRDVGAGVLTVDVPASSSVPLFAESFIVTATTGEEVTVDPMAHVRGGAAPPRLAAVPAKSDAAITADLDRGTFRFSSDEARTHLIEYTVTDGGEPVTGQVRIEVETPPTRETVPITVPHTAFVRSGQSLDVDVLATDIDPLGGVLLITAADRSAIDPTVQVEVVDHRILRVTLLGPLQYGSSDLTYRVGNGLAEATGTVTVVEVPPPARPQPPIATPDHASARTGDVIDIDVLDNDEHPDGEPLTLAPDLVEEPGAGLAFVSEGRLRYLAPDEPGEYQAVYQVEGPDGQPATAAVSLSVRPAEADTNQPPVPAVVTARAIAGETVRIPIPLGQIDPDGDSVQLLGQVSAPERGTVVTRGADQLEYTAGEYSSGTDTFKYEVTDALGARATGTVRVGIAPRPEGARVPVAVSDAVTVRPGRTVAVRVLDNDSDADGGALAVTDLEPTAGNAVGRVVDGVVLVDVPDAEGTYAFVYTVANEQFATASTYLQVHASADAPLSRPEVADVVIGLSEIVDRDAVVVDVLETTFVADAPGDRAAVSLVAGYDEDARIRADGTVRVAVHDSRRIVPFTVAHPDDPTLTSTAVIVVPGRDDAIPQLRRDAPAVRVDSGDEVVLDLADYVIAASGRPVTIADPSSVVASHSDGSDLVVDANTVRFRSETGYFGPASISFVASDGDPLQDPDARSGTVVIPITVRPATGLPPAFTGAVLDLQPDESKQIGLRRLTNQPGAGSGAKLSYGLGPIPDGFTASLEGDQLTVRADGDAPRGLTGELQVSVADADGEGTPGVIELRVVASTRPLAQPVADRAVVERGRSTSIDVLENDQAGNPFPDTPLRVIGVRGADAQSLPAGIRVAPSGDRSTLVVTVAADAQPANATLQYQVADATGDSSRYAWGTVSISVQDRPGPVSDARVTGFADRELTIAFGAGTANNAPITAYEVELLDAGSREPVGDGTCASTTCTVSTPGNGQGSAVVVRIRARNAIGLSEPVEIPGSVWSDVVPDAPSGLRADPLDGRLRIRWDPVRPEAGSTVGSYVVTVAGVAAEVAAGAVCTATSCTLDSQALPNGSQVPISVSARNQAYPALSAWNAATTVGVPFGAPIASGIQLAADAPSGTVTVAWSPFDANGDAIGGYFVQQLVPGAGGVPTGPQACTVNGPAPADVIPPTAGGTVAASARVGPETTSIQFGGLTAEAASYSFVVWGFNRAGCVPTAVATTVVRTAPPSISGVSSGMQWMSETTWDRFIIGVQTTAATQTMQIVPTDRRGTQIGAPRTFAGSGWTRDLFGRPFGETAYFQVRACTSWGSCGPWSENLPADEGPSLTFEVPGMTWNESGRGWSWWNPPENSGLPAAFRCGVEGDDRGRTAAGWGWCDIPTARPGDRVWLDVEVAGVTARFWNR